MLKITATDLHRFMNCNGSRLTGTVLPVNPDTTVTDEGNAAHWFIEQVFRKNFSAEELIDRKAPNGVYITPEMSEHCEDFLQHAIRGGFIEIDTSYMVGPITVSGRADHIVFENGTLIVSDFKYGWKIVEPQNNWTLISHACGFLFANPEIMRMVTQVVLRIYQPRAFHYSGLKVRECILTMDELWGCWSSIKHTLENPSDECRTGDHCHRCPSRAMCPAALTASMNVIDVSESGFNSHNTSDEDLSELLNTYYRAEEMLKQMIDAYEDLALHRIKEGKNIKGYTGQISAGKTQWKDGVTADFIKMISGVDVTSPKMMTPNQAKNAGLSEDVVKAYTERPSTGFKLVRMDASKKAELLFGKKGK